MILGVVGGGFTAAAAATASDGPTATSASGLAAVQDDGEENETDDGGQGNETEMGGQDNETDGQQADRIPITEAMQAAEEETEDQNATVVGAEVGQQDGGLLDFGDGGDEVYTVDVLLANGTHIEVAVNATNGSVVDRGQQEEGFLEGIFGEDQMPQQPLNLSAMHNATEAVELAQNETGDNGTVTSVGLNQRDDQLVYEVQIDQGDDQTTVVVDAMKDGQGVIEVDGQQMGGEETDAGAGNETGEGDGDGGMDGGNETDEGGDGA